MTEQEREAVERVEARLAGTINGVVEIPPAELETMLSLVKRQGDGAVTISREVFDFLMGEGPLEGVWFDELNEGLPGAFWWRGLLKAAAGWPDARSAAPPVMSEGVEE